VRLRSGGGDKVRKVVWGTAPKTLFTSLKFHLYSSTDGYKSMARPRVDGFVRWLRSFTCELRSFPISITPSITG
jgi:hypothetical protein